MNMPNIAYEQTMSVIQKRAKGWEELALNVAILTQSTIYEDDDALIFFDGKEGSGKSKFMRKVAYFIQGLYEAWGVPQRFTLDNIHFSAEEYIDNSLAKKDEQSIGHINILDESRKDLLRISSNSKSNKNFTNYLSMIRDANQIHLLAAPAFHDIDKNVFMWRMRLLIHTEKKHVVDKSSPTGFKLKRGTFKAYMKNRALIDAYFGKIRYLYPKKCEFSGTFDNNDPIDENLYREKKALKRKEALQDEEVVQQENKKDMRLIENRDVSVGRIDLVKRQKEKQDMLDYIKKLERRLYKIGGEELVKAERITDNAIRKHINKKFLN